MQRKTFSAVQIFEEALIFYLNWKQKYQGDLFYLSFSI